MKKFRVIIVDDEMLIRKLIRMKLDTENLEIEIVGEFSDTKSAYEALDCLQPDIILSDICMPGEDGISFSEKCVQKCPHIRVIIITGYNDFDYARRSLKAGVYDYLMKPIQGEELNATLKKAIDEIKKEVEKEEKQRLLMEEVESNLPALRKIYMNQIMLQDTLDENLEDKLGNYGVKVNRNPNGALCLCLVSIRECLERPDLVIAIRQEMEEFFRSEEYIQIVEDSWARIVIISNSSDFPLDECMNIVIPMIQKKYDCHLMVGMSQVFESWFDIRKAYQNVLDTVQKQHGNRKSEISDQSEDTWNQICLAIEEQRFEDARKAGHEMIERIVNPLNGEMLNLFTQQIYSDMDLRQEEIMCGEYIKNCKTKQEMKWWMDNFLTELMILRGNTKGNKELIKQVVTYMNQHIENPEMNLGYLADEFGVSTSHLSRSIKQFTGKNYGDLLSDFRMIRMIYMMNNTKLKDWEIGEKIGIEDAHYLSIWFKKVTSQSVSEYRKQIAEGKEAK